MSLENKPEISNLDEFRKAIIEGALDAVVGVDQNDIIIEWNRQAENIFGWSKKEAIGHSVHLIVPKRFREAHSNGVKHFLKTGEGPILNKRIELQALNKKKETFPIELTVIPIYFQKTYLFYSFIRDITERKRIENELLLRSESIENSLNAFDIVDETGKFIYVNKAYVNMWGYESPEEIIGSSPVLHCADPTVPTKIISELKEKGESNIEFLAKRKDGSTFYVHMFARLAHDPEGKEIYPTTAIDITKRVIADQKNERLQKRMIFLSDATKNLLADPLNYESRLNQIAEMIVPQISDWCIIDLLTNDELRLAAAAHVDPSKVSLAYQLRESYPVKPHNSSVWNVIIKGKSELVPDISDELLQSETESPEHYQMIKKLGLRSYICVPLVARGKKLGAITFVLDWPRQPFSDEDLRFCEELADRTALGLDNALLYRQARESEKRLDIAQKAGNSGTFEWHIPTNKVLWSEELEALYGLTPGSFQNTYEEWSKIIHPDDLSLFEENLKEAIHKGSFHSEFRVIMPDGRIRWLMGRGEVFLGEDNKPDTVLGINVDITELKVLEEELQKAIKARDEFISICSHELKTPVTAMKLQFQHAERQLKKGEPDAMSRKSVERRIDIANRQLDRMTNLIEEMLDVSRISSGKLQLHLESVDLYELTKEVLDRFNEQFNSADIEWTLKGNAGDAFVECDRFRMEQVVSNLLTNALKYGNEKPIEVSVQRNQDNVSLCVSDQGIGIPKEHQARVFDRYERAISPTSISGLGLGLYISGQIVEAHHGKIFLESEPGKGSVFTILIPSEKV